MATVSKERILELIKPSIADNLDVEADAVTSDKSFVDDLKADSLDLVELIMLLEELCEKEFGTQVKISDQEAETVKTVGDAVDLVYEKLSA